MQQQPMMYLPYDAAAAQMAAKKKKAKQNVATVGAILPVGIILLLVTSRGYAFGMYQMVISLPAILIGLIVLAMGASEGGLS